MVSKNRSTLSRNMRKVSNRKLPQGDYNCYCFAAYTTGLYDRIQWIYSEEMKGYLKKTKKVEEPQPGDIVAMWGDDHCFNGKSKRMDLIHTAVCVSKDRYLHKPGGWDLEYASWDRIMEVYDSKSGFITNKVTYHRI